MTANTVRRQLGGAFVVVDVQRDFCPGGALPVSQGDSVLAVCNLVAHRHREAGRLVVFSRDWHPADHMSFKSQGGLWPAHCVQNTKGAEFHPDLDVEPGDLIVSKAIDRERDAYSVFQGTDLAVLLKTRGIERLVVAGLATEFCVKATVLDAIEMGFEVVVLSDGIAAIEAEFGDAQRALDEMIAAGAEIKTSHDF